MPLRRGLSPTGSPAVPLLALLGLCVAARGQIAPTTSSTSCVTSGCHGDVVTHRTLHGPVAQQKCLACHVERDPENHRFEIIGDPAQLCITCHTLPARTVTHTPVAQGNCTGCHDPHGSEYPVMLVADPIGGLCVSCHREQHEPAAEFVHGPVAAGACILCHEPHGAWHPMLLTEGERNLCLGCHSEIAPDPDRDRYRHEPAEVACSQCHDAHGSNHRYHLLAEGPALCDSCHDQSRIHRETATVVHGALLQPGGCRACHAPHASARPALQRAEEIDLCLSCHAETLQTADGRTITDMAALLRDNPDHHGPIRDGNCTACHAPHVAEEPNLLRLAYPPEFYAPFETERYALCFECHRPDLVNSPVGTGVTRFRDGDVNLHALHVNQEKGRTCRACHEVHASRNPFHIRDAVPFGSRGWMLEIRYEPTVTGGRCAPGCHAPARYDHGSRLPGPPPPPIGNAP